MALETFVNSEPFTFGVELEIHRQHAQLRSDQSGLRPDAPNPGRDLPGQHHAGNHREHDRAVDRHLPFARAGGERAACDPRRAGEGGRPAQRRLAGGGTHAFQQWSDRQIYDAPRFQYISELYGYLAKQFTVFGQHVHIGCPDPDSALFLLHSMSRFIPHFIALSASSPFVQNVDTGFHSARLNSVFAFPLSGRAPFVLTWDSFEEYFTKMVNTGVVNSMKDFYWDIRPKPGYGTIEVRVMDTPLSVDRAAAIACYIQTLARYLLTDRPLKLSEDDYLVYTFNRFEACRFEPRGAPA